jgi:PEP-CTERM motif
VKILLTSILALAAFSASAAPTVFFGENQNPANAVSGAPLTAQSSFLSNLSGVGTEVFSQASGSGSPLAVAFPGSSGNITATLTGQGAVSSNVGAGRFNTSSVSSGWWEVSGIFNITFDTAISAFGFYGTDVGDFNGQLTIALTDVNDIVTNYVVNNTINGNNGSLLFWGFIDAGNSYKRVAFGNTASGVDFFGFDDMVIGDARQITNPGEVPEPTSIALLGLGLLGVVAARKRKQA